MRFRTKESGDVYPIGDRDKLALSEILDAEDAGAGPDPREQPCVICGRPTPYRVQDMAVCTACWQSI
jgi:hypothetical protein